MIQSFKQWEITNIKISSSEEAFLNKHTTDEFKGIKQELGKKMRKVVFTAKGTSTPHVPGLWHEEYGQPQVLKTTEQGQRK